MAWDKLPWRFFSLSLSQFSLFSFCFQFFFRSILFRAVTLVAASASFANVRGLKFAMLLVSSVASSFFNYFFFSSVGAVFNEIFVLPRSAAAPLKNKNKLPHSQCATRQILAQRCFSVFELRSRSLSRFMGHTQQVAGATTVSNLQLQLQLQPFSYFMYFACLKMFQFLHFSLCGARFRWKGATAAAHFCHFNFMKVSGQGKPNNCRAACKKTCLIIFYSNWIFVNVCVCMCV